MGLGRGGLGREEEEGRRERFLGDRERRGDEGNKPVTSYTPSSIMMYKPLSASLCDATSATEKDFDILVSRFLPTLLFAFLLLAQSILVAIVFANKLGGIV